MSLYFNKFYRPKTSQAPIPTPQEIFLEMDDRPAAGKKSGTEPKAEGSLDGRLTSRIVAEARARQRATRWRGIKDISQGFTG